MLADVALCLSLVLAVIQVLPRPAAARPVGGGWGEGLTIGERGRLRAILQGRAPERG